MTISANKTKTIAFTGNELSRTKILTDDMLLEQTILQLLWGKISYGYNKGIKQKINKFDIIQYNRYDKN